MHLLARGASPGAGAPPGGGAPKAQKEIAQGNALGSTEKNKSSPERAREIIWVSIPDIALIEWDSVFSEQAPVFLLKRRLAMMLALAGDVSLQRGAVRR